MVGLNGVVVKSHGGTDGPGFAHAVDVAMDMVVHRFNDRIREGLGRIGPQLPGYAAEQPGPQRDGGIGTHEWISAAQRAATTASASRPPAEGGHQTATHPGPAPTPLTRAVLAGIGAYLPENVVTNDELAGRVETSDGWIRERTGIRQRHLAAPHETCAFMASAAARAALADAGAAAEEVDAIVLGTSTPDQVFPATAVRVQAEIGAGGFAFDLSAACSGFIYALSVADSLVRSGQARGVLVIGAEVFSRILNWQDRGTCVLFGDGAGAVFLRASDGAVAAPIAGILSTHLHSDGRLGDILYVDGAVGRPDRSGHLIMNGREVFRHAVTRLSDAVDEALAANGLAARRRRLAGAAPGQRPHHRRDRPQARPAGGARGA